MIAPNLPDEQEPVTPAPRHRRRWRWIALAVADVLALCLAAPVGYVAWPLVTGTLKADHGEGSPGAALLAFVFTFDDAPDAIGVDRLILPDRREQIGRQRRDYLRTMTADRKATGWAGRFEIGTEQPGDGAQVHVDRAIVVDSYRVVWTPPAGQRAGNGGAVVWYNGEPHARRAEVRQDRTGWRLWSITIPAWRGVAWRGVAWRGVAWRGVAWRGVAWRGVAWRGTYSRCG